MTPGFRYILVFSGLISVFYGFHLNFGLLWCDFDRHFTFDLTTMLFSSLVRFFSVCSLLGSGIAMKEVSVKIASSPALK